MTTAVPLFGRKVTVTIGNPTAKSAQGIASGSAIQVTDLAMSFSVKKTLKPEPNTCDLTIYNLSPDHRAALEQMQVATVQIEAGYQEGTSVLFVGDLRTGVSTHTGVDYETKLSSGDGEKAIKTARVNVAMKKGTATPAKVLQAVASALGVGSGNLSQAVAKLQGAGIANNFSEGVVLSGSAFREMNSICRTCALSWSIQNGKLQILPLGQALQTSAIQIDQNSGMVGAPTIDNDGVLNVKTLLIPDVFPGRLLVLNAQRLKGNYRIESCKYDGETHGQNWYNTIQAKRY